MRNCLKNEVNDQEEDWGNHNHPFAQKVERFAAVDGQDVMHLYTTEAKSGDSDNNDNEILPLLEWDATQNAQYDKHIQPPMTKQMTPGEVGCAMSHIRLWKELADMETRIPASTAATSSQTSGGGDGGENKAATMLILEDDAILYQEGRGGRGRGRPSSKGRQRQSHQPGGNNTHHQNHHHYHKNGQRGRYSDSFAALGWRNSSRSLDSTSSLEEHHHHHPESSESSTNGGGAGFIQALLDVEKILPKDWDILYLGLSDRGERKYIDHGADTMTTIITMPVTLFRPTYGFHTHAYALTQKAANVLLENLPVQGPLDVWLADNQWFGLDVYCASIEDGTSFKGKRGAQLVSQQRRVDKSDIVQSGRVSL